MISLSECAQCRARRLQEESDVEFKKRYGMIDLNRAPLQMGWKPYMGQVTAAFPATSAVPPVPPEDDSYLEQTKWRLGGFAVRGAMGFPVGLLMKAAFKGLRMSRKEEALFSMGAAGIGLAAALMPWKGSFWDRLAAVAGGLTGLGLGGMVIPAKRNGELIAPAI